MHSGASTRSAIQNAAFTLLVGMGILVAIIGLALDYLLPYTSPGFNLPQLLLVVAGLTISLVAFVMRREDWRGRVYKSVSRHWAPVLAITLLTLIALEFLLFAAGMGTYYPAEIPEKRLEPVPWWHCDDAGCRYVFDELVKACDSDVLSGRRCLVNRQGYQDSGDFVAVEDNDESMRILMLGDSFTAGYHAEIGKSYVETIEAYFPESHVWNTAIPSTGTNHALASFAAHAPLLRPQIAVLGFYVNDFKDNISPIDSYLEVLNLETEAMLMIKLYRVDVWGNVFKLDADADLYYRLHDVDPPASELKRIVGTTRLGSLFLRLVDALGEIIFQDARYERTVDITRDYLRELSNAAIEQGAALLAILIPHEDNLDHASRDFHSAVQLMRELEIPYIDLLGLLDQGDYVGESDFHWNTAGHQKVGALLSACLEVFFASGDLAQCEHVEAP